MTRIPSSELGLDTGLLEQIVELQPCTMDNCRTKTDGMKGIPS